MGKFALSIVNNCIVAVIATLLMKLIGALTDIESLLPLVIVTHEGRTILTSSQLLLLTIFLLSYMIAATYFSTNVIINTTVGRISPQLLFFSEIYRYASNGSSSYKIVTHANRRCMRIALKNESLATPGKRTGHKLPASEAGLIIAKNLRYPPFTKGYCISDKSHLSFDIMGGAGNERIGVSIKNTKGIEKKIDLEKDHNITLQPDRWYTVRIDLNDYPQVARHSCGKEYLECIAFYSNSVMKNTDSVQSFYISNVRFEQDTN